MSNHSDLTAALQAHQLTVQAAVSRIAAERDADTRDFLIPCEQCGALHQYAESYSACLWLAFAGSRLAGGFQMQEAASPSAPPHQHFCCSEACLSANVATCLTEHYLPAARQRHVEAQARTQ